VGFLNIKDTCHGILIKRMGNMFLDIFTIKKFVLYLIIKNKLNE